MGHGLWVIDDGQIVNPNKGACSLTTANLQPVASLL